MNELRNKLRPFFAKVTIPTAVASVVIWAVARNMEPMLDAQASAKVMMMLIISIAAAFCISSFVMHKADSSRAGQDEERQAEIFAPAYKARIVTLNACAILSAVSFAVSHDDSAIYLVGILMIVLLLSYPTEQFVSKR